MTELPLDILDSHLAVVGKVGSGKTYAAKGLVERLLDAGRRVCVIDPTGAWFGLRSGADGVAPGYPVVIFGGDHGDVPINDKAGAILARLVVERVDASVIDLSAFNLSERRRLAHDFLAELHLLNRTPLHLVIDEADELAPQNPMAETKRLLHEVDRIVRRGRIKGFRVTMITQRPAVLHKNVLTQANALIAMRITSPQDRKAIIDWISAFDKAAANRIGASFATLSPGQGWVWAPDHDRLDQVAFPPIKTFDSSRAPKVGDAPAEAPKLAHVDLAEIRAALAVVDEKPAPKGKTSPQVTDDMAAALTAEYRRGAADGHAEGLTEGAEKATKDLALSLRGDGFWLFDYSLKLVEIAERLTGENVATVAGWRERFAGAQAKPAPLHETAPQVHQPAAPVHRPQTAPQARVNGAAAGGTPMPRAERLILTALAQHRQGRTKVQLAVLTGYAVNGGGFKNALGALRSKEFAAGSDHLVITPAGIKTLGPFEPLPTGPALLAHWRAQLDKAGRLILDAVAEVYPKALTRDQIAYRAGYDPNGGGFKNALGRLRTLELVRGRGEIRASEDLFG